MKRRVIQRRVVVLLLLLGAGAIVNVAVAWIIRADLYANDSCDYVNAQPTTRDLWKEFVGSLRVDQELKESRYRRFGTQVTEIFLPYEASPMTFADFDDMTVLDAGWPFHSMRGIQVESAAFTTYEFLNVIMDLRPMCYIGWHELPSRPLWPGFAINTIFYAAILWAVFFVPGKLRRTLRRTRGLCPACAYPVGTSPVCTECGKPLA